MAKSAPTLMLVPTMQVTLEEVRHSSPSINELLESYRLLDEKCNLVLEKLSKKSDK